MGLLSNSNAIESGGYNIERSLRFRSSASAYLNRTPASAGNRQTWTWSGWIKRGLMNSYHPVFSAGNNTVLMFNTDLNQGIGLYDYNGSTLQYYLATNAVFRDPSAWYHIVAVLDTTNATLSNRVRLYINGQRVSSFSTESYPSLNYQTYWNNSGVTHHTGAELLNSRYFDGYLAEVNFIDGQALTPSSFGEFSTETGVWVPKKYTGTYGTNGFYLDFKDNTSATTLAYDKSGNGNNWTANNISTTAGATYDSMTDVPTLTSATAANFAVMNPLENSSASYSNANLGVTMSGVFTFTSATLDIPSTGKFYWEYVGTTTGASRRDMVGVGRRTTSRTACASINGDGIEWLGITGGVYQSNSVLATYITWDAGDIIGVAYDSATGFVWFSKNGTWINSGNPSAGTGYVGTAANNNNITATVSNGGAAGYGTIGNINFGQRPFSFTPPTGFKALNTFNLPDPVIKKPGQYMTATTYTGNGGTQSIVNAAGFQPDLVWAKCRSSPSDHALYDSVRGIYQDLASSTTGAETTQTTGLISFNANGFTTGSYSKLNASGPTYVGWQWKKGATPGFDIVTYTGNNTAGRTVSHSLGIAPSLIIVKDRTGAGVWQVRHARVPVTQTLELSSAVAAYTSAVWNNTAPTSSVFTVGTGLSINQTGENYVAYLFAEIPGFSKFGSYTGNGSTDGPFVYCGFRPKYVMIKETTVAGRVWDVKDSTRNLANETNSVLYPHASAAEATPDNPEDFLSNGFKLRSNATSTNIAGGNYIYMAFAENPFKYSNAR